MTNDDGTCRTDDGTHRTGDDGTHRTDFISHHHRSKGSARRQEQPGVHLAVYKDPFAGIAAKGHSGTQGQGSRIYLLAKTQPREPFLSHIASQPLVLPCPAAWAC